MLGGPKTQGSKNNRAGFGQGLQMPTGIIAGSGASQMANRSVYYGAATVTTNANERNLSCMNNRS